MKTLFLRSYYYVLVAFLCASSVCLAADSVVAEAAPVVVQGSISSANTDSAVSSVKATVSAPVVSSSAVPAPSVEELQKRNAERASVLAARHAQTKALLAKLQVDAAPIIEGLKKAKENVERQSVAAAQIAALAPMASSSPAIAPVPLAVPSVEAPK